MYDEQSEKIRDEFCFSVAHEAIIAIGSVQSKARWKNKCVSGNGSENFR